MPAPGFPETLTALRRRVTTLERLASADERILPLGLKDFDAVLGGGLALGAVHEIFPAAAVDFGAASGFALALAARASRSGKTALWVQTDFARRENGCPYGLGLDLFGLGSERLLVVRAARAAEVLFAMEEALKCRALGAVIAELANDGIDLTATRRLSLAAREGGAPGLLLHQRAPLSASAAATRFEVAAAAGARDNFGGIGRTTFNLSLVKNRRGPCGRWTLGWNHHEQAFVCATHSLALAAPAGDGPDRAERAFARAG
jgi:protein ImuA